MATVPSANVTAITTATIFLIPLPSLLYGVEKSRWASSQILPVPLLVTMTVNLENPAIPTFPFYIEHLPALGPGNLPARLLLVLISRAIGIDIF
jgi:hypothetical protein